MALVDSLLTAMVRANGDALVMHAGEKPIVVAGSKTIDLSTHGMNLGAMIGMLGQLLPADAQASLEEDGAVEHRLPSRGTDHFTVVAARGGEDIWIEIRRRRDQAAAPAVTASEPAAPAEVVAVQAVAEVPAAGAVAAPVAETSPNVSPATADVAEVPVSAAGAIIDVAEVTAFGEVAPSLAAAEMSESGASDVVAPAGEVVMSGPPRPEESPSVAAEAVHADAAPHAEQPEPQTTAIEPVTPPASSVIAAAPAAEAHPEIADAPIEAIAAPQETAEVGAPDPVPVMAAAGASVHPDVQMTPPMAPMDFTPQPPAPPVSKVVAPTPPAASTAPTGGVTSGGSEPPSTPVTRTVRIEVPSRAVPARSTTADRLLRAASGHAASELFLMSQVRPYIRVDGDIRGLDDELPLQAADVESMLEEVTPEPWRDAVRRGDPAEWLMEFADVGRVRCATFRDHRGPGAIFHFNSTHAATADQLGLDANLRLLATEPDGLVVVSGPAGSGKSAIVAAFVDIINRHRGDYVITLEPQVRVIHEHHQALVSQREVGKDLDRGLAMARAALRENPDVLVIEDVVSGELIALALDAANDGRLVVVSLEVASTVDAVQQLIELVPAERRSAARVALAQSFRGAVAQLLLRKAAGGRIAAREVLMGTGAVARMIAEGHLPDLSATLEASRDAGSAPMVEALVGYVRSGVVDVREAFRRAPDRERFVAGLEAAGVDTAAVDRLV